jgi:dethiobiotin synthetase
MKSYFVTGTDTGVGKTTVSVGILATLRQRGKRVLALKPVETGCDPDPLDALALEAATGQASPPVVYCFTPPVAPAVAARHANVRIDLEAIRRAMPTADEADLLLVEGAGGLLVPYTDELLAADLVHSLRLPLLIVARASLGTINHTLLTVFEARRRGLEIAGVILNRVVAARGPDEDDNASEIERLGDVKILGIVPHGGDVTAAFDPAILL